MRRLRLRWRTTASAAVLAAGAAVFVLAAVTAEGVPVRHVDLHDGGIWVTSDHDGLFGRLNKPAGALDAAFNPPGGAQPAYTLDVVQDGDAAAAWDRGAGKLLPIDPARAAIVGDQGASVGAEQDVQLAGGTLAVLDAKTGKIWAVRAGAGRGPIGLGGLDQQGMPVATVGDRAALAVGRDGTIHAVSAAGRVATVSVEGSGFASPQYTNLGHAIGDPHVTVVGSTLVALDGRTGALTVAGGGSADLGGDAHAVLQQPGPAAGTVVVATGRALLGVELKTGHAAQLATVASGTPTAPVRLDNCVHAAWSGAGGGYLRSCDAAPATRGNLKDAGVLERPVFRVNRGAIVLNDLTSGAVWDLGDQRRVDNWSAVRPPPVPKDGDKNQNNQLTNAALQKPPKAVDDTWGARPGRTTLLHVLDNDSDPGGSILAITAVTAPDNPQARVTIAADGQTVAITVPAAGPAVHFRYTVDDGRNNASAQVTVQIRGPGDNQAPKVRAGYLAPARTVASGGQLSIPVIGDWRDFDGDPIGLVDAAAKAGTVTTTPDGGLSYTAPVPGGVQHLTYRVSDGIGAPASGAVDVTVQAPTATVAVAAVTQPDVARGEVGLPITIRPLDNDLPGADPADPAAHLALAGDVAGPAGTTVVTNLKTGTVVLSAAKPGPYLLTYKAAFGNAPFAAGSIRVDVVPVPTSPAPPVAMPDAVVLHGQLPATVDVLANDFDPAGQVLVVQHAQAADPASRLSVAVVQGHWLRIAALDAAGVPAPQLVHYTVTDGITAPVSGDVTVTRLIDAADTRPVPSDDYATVRAGDSVTVAVLDNDTNPGGAAMSLAGDVTGAPGPGQLSVTGARGGGPDQLGRAYVAGNLVRYVPPATLSAPLSVTVDYAVRNAAGDQAIGHLRVSVVPPPGAGTPNRPPAPLPIEARATAGQTLTLRIATAGVDPDGDSVAVTGVASAPTLGRVLSVNATSLVYQAYPTSAGTDTFTYRVVDRFGLAGESTVRVGVTPPGAPQPPVAVDDDITAAPGAHLHADVLANDLYAADDTVTVSLVDDAGAAVRGPLGPIDVTAPDLSGKPLTVVYALSDGLGRPSLATLTVHSQRDVDLPPVAVDAYPAVDKGAASITVDVLAACADPDGAAADLVLAHAYDPETSIVDGKLVIKVTGPPRTVPFEIRDPGGATAIGLVHVPAPGAGAPYAKPGATVKVDRNGATTVPLADYVVDPAGKPVRLTTVDRVWAAPAAGVTAKAAGEHDVALAAHGDYTGPASVTFEVTDGATLTDQAAQTAVVTLPVQVGPPTPVLHCPSDPVPVVEGGAPLAIDVTSVCHVWAPDRATLPGLSYTAAWHRAIPGVSIGGAGTHTVGVTAEAGAVPGAGGTIAVGVAGSDAVVTDLPVIVAAAAPPSVGAVTVDGVKAGDTATVDMSRYVRSELRRPVISAVSVSQSEGMPATATSDGATVRLTPSAEAHGTLTFVVTMTDVADRGRADRRVTGRITLHVLGVPDAPGTPAIDRTVLSRSVSVSWAAPASNGAPVDTYEVDYPGGSQRCAASPCLITGLTNGRTYTFTVKAHNLVGWSRPSGTSEGAEPNTVPGAVTGLTASDPQDGTLRLAWAAPPNDGTPVLRYDVSWSGGGRASATGPGLTATGLDNDIVYTFTVIAVNAKGPGEAATVQGQSAGVPATPAAPAAASANSADSAARAVTLSWPASDPNGPGPVTYAVTRTGGGTRTVCTGVTARQCTDDGLANDGTVYTYSLSATNGVAGHTSAASPGTTVEAAATPGAVGRLSATPTGVDGQATLQFDAPASHGATSTVSCTYGGTTCGTWTFPPGGQSGVSETVNGLPNGQNVTVSLQDCNGSRGGNGAGAQCGPTATAGVTTYGPLKNLNIQTSASGTAVNFTISVDPNGKPATVTVQTSRQTQTFTTGVGAWSWSGSDTMGYSQTDTITVTVADSGRSALTGSKSQATPPPPPTVTLSKGARCGGGGGAACAGGVCSSASCAYIHVQTANFTGNVTCTFDSQHGPGGFITQTWGPNQSKDSGNWYGYPGEWVRATCGGVTGQMTWS
ncbi:fibronectin type III domain-containing protein [Dactylosporangium vinaceum]|uniref:Ig-like domain-containing protein n=1 Tax=Dactylosporangium vinaceum TaxID=53362 RepID=A0ABV5MK08_9ACTN|nr:Ig-like domain-containing protein [Dactylosporangium vinaceum]UAB92760.1 fibronectin type III domain-containing protein [Dactylosporangium vinaceum]